MCTWWLCLRESEGSSEKDEQKHQNPPLSDPSPPLSSQRDFQGDVLVQNCPYHTARLKHMKQSVPYYQVG